MVWYLSAVLYLWELFRLWTHTIFVTPFQNVNMLWLLVPVWLSWFFAEFFQEKVGTSMGNAITNAVLILWGSIDCSRQTVALIAAKTIEGTGNIALRFALIGVIFIYGILIVTWGIKGNTIVKKIGRIRQVTYVFAMFVPIFYNAIPFSWKHIIAVVIFYPLFYFVIEIIDKIVPNPKSIEQDMNSSKSSSLDSFDLNDFGSNSGQGNPSFNSYNPNQNFNQGFNNQNFGNQRFR